MSLLLRYVLVIVLTLVSFFLLFTEGGRKKMGWFLYNVVAGALDFVPALLTEFAPGLHSIKDALVNAIATHGTPVAQELAIPFQDMARAILEAQKGSLASLGESTPDNAIDSAAEAFTVAYGAGLSSAAVAALFESIFPEKLNVMNGVAPMIGKMAGFDEVAAHVLDPLYEAAFGTSLKYKYLSTFKPELPAEEDAVTWHARRLLDDAGLRKIFHFSGLKPEYEDAFVASAYRALSPRVLATAIDDTAFDPAPLRDSMRFGGLRDADIDRALDAFSAAALKGLRKAVISAAEANFVAGLTTDTEFSDSIDSLGVSDAAKGLIILAATEKRLKTLTEEYRKGWDAKFLAKDIDAADYRLALSGLGYSSPVLDGIIGGSQGRLDAIEFKEEEAAAKQRRRKEQEIAVQAAMTAFKRGEIDIFALTAALTVAGLDATQVALYVALAEARGQTVAAKSRVARSEAQKLEIKAAIEEYTKGDVTEATLRAKLLNAGMQTLAIDAEISYLNARGAKGQALS